MGTEVGWDNDKINKWVMRCIDEVMVGMEQLRVWAEEWKGQRWCGRGHRHVWKRALACTGMCGCAWGCAVVDKGLGICRKGGRHAQGCLMDW